MDNQTSKWQFGHGRRWRRKLTLFKRNRAVSCRNGRKGISNLMERFIVQKRAACHVHEAGFFLVITLTIVVWLLGAALFWYTDVERTTRRLSEEILAIRFESHLLLAKERCGDRPLTLHKPTGTLTCRPIAPNRTEVNIVLTSGERHKEVMVYE